MGDEQTGKKPALDYGRPPAPRVPIYRRVLAGGMVLGGMVLAGIALVVCGAFVGNESARVNIWTAGGGLVVLGVVIRFQHVRL